MIRRFIGFVAAFGLVASPALGQQKPLVIINGQTQQLPAGTTLGVRAATTGAASINIPQGTAPTSPNNGDCWTTTAGYFCRVEGATVNMAYTLQTGTGAVAKTLDDRVKTDPISIVDFLSSAQLADVQARTLAVDVTTPVQNWLAACIAQHRACEAIAGAYKVTGQITFDQAGNLSNGLTVFSSAPGQTVFQSTYTGGTPFRLIASGGSPSAPVSATYPYLSGLAFQCTYAGACLTIGQHDYSDQINEFTLWRISVQNFDTSASSTAYEFNAVFSGNVYANGATAAAPGRILTLGAITGGSGYVNGTYSNVSLTDSGEGEIATANITVSGGAVTGVTLVSGGVLYHAADVLSAAASSLGGSGSGFSIPVATVATNHNDIYRIRQAAFTNFKIGGSSGWNFVNIEDSFTYGNTFQTPDCEVVATCFRIVSANAVRNTTIGGQFAYSSYGYGVEQNAGGDSAFINPNINGTVANFISPGSDAYAKRWKNDTIAFLAGPTFSGTVTVANAAASSIVALTSNGKTTNIYEDTSGNLQLNNTSSGGFMVISQDGAGTIQTKINGAQVGAVTPSATTINNKLSLASGTPTCGTNCSSIGANSTDQKFLVNSSASVASVTVNFGSAFAVAPKCTANTTGTTVVGISAVSTTAITFALPASTTTSIYATCFQ